MDCVCCGSGGRERRTVLWPELIAEWRLSAADVECIEHQQGTHCSACGANLRSQALARAVLWHFGFEGTFETFILDDRFADLRVLEINEAGDLSGPLSQMRRRVLTTYPEVDMMALPFESSSFDLVIHSDTLEHVPDPVAGLRECRRVVTSHGCCAFTVPLLVDRLTVSRQNMPESFHGSRDEPVYLVHWEYGADVWTHALRAGFGSCTILSAEYPAAQALVCSG